MGNDCLKRKEMASGRLEGMYICDHCREVRPWPPHIIATVRTQRTWFFFAASSAGGLGWEVTDAPILFLDFFPRAREEDYYYCRQ